MGYSSRNDGIHRLSLDSDCFLYIKCSPLNIVYLSMSHQPESKILQEPVDAEPLF